MVEATPISWSHVQVYARVGFTRDGRADRVHDSQHHGALFAPFAQGRQRVDRLTALRDGDHRRAVFENWVSVAEFAGVFRLARDARQLLDQELAHQAGVPGRAARRQNDALGLDQLARYRGQAAQYDAVAFQVDASAQAVAHGFRLLKNLLEHEVLMSAQFELLQRPFDLLDLLGDRCRVERLRAKPVAPYDRDLIVRQVDYARRVLHDCGRIRRDDVLVLADSEYQRAATPAATITSGSSAWITAMPNVPRTSRSACRTAFSSESS